MKNKKSKIKKCKPLTKTISICLLLVIFLSSFLTFNSPKATSFVSNDKDNFQDINLYLYPFNESYGHKMNTTKYFSVKENVEYDMNNIKWEMEHKLSNELFIKDANLTLNITNPSNNSVDINITLFDDDKIVASNNANISANQTISNLSLEFAEGENYTFEMGSIIFLQLSSNNKVNINYENAKLVLTWKNLYGVLLTCENPEKIFDIGNPINLFQTYDINLKNIGEEDDTIVLEILDYGNKRWFSKLSNNNVTLIPGGSKNITLFVSPLNITDGEQVNITVKASSTSSPFPIYYFLNTTTTAKKTYGFKMDCLFYKSSIKWGEHTNYTIIVTNNKTTNVTIDFNISIPPLGWTASLNKEKIILGELGQTASIILTVAAPKNYLENAKTKTEITVIGCIKNESVSSKITMITTIKENPQIKINEIIFSDEHPKDGQEIKISANISNIGLENATVLVLFYDGNINESAIIGIRVMELTSNQTDIAIIFWNVTYGEHSIVVVVKTLDLSLSLDIASKNINVSKEEGIQDFVIVASGGAIGIAFLIALATETGRYSIFKIFALPLYTRIRKDRVLDHEVRQKVYAYIQSNPGAHFRSIMKSLSLKNGALAYHLATLERAEYIKSQRDGMYRKFYLKPGRLGEPSKILKTPEEVRKLILEKIRMEPGISQSKIAKSIGESRQLVNNYIKVLREEGKIYLKKNGRESRCFIEET